MPEDLRTRGLPCFFQFRVNVSAHSFFLMYLFAWRACGLFQFQFAIAEKSLGY